MAAASAAGDAAQFFGAARSVLQQVLSVHWQIEPEQVTTAEVDARLGAQDPHIRRLFALADEANYSGRAPRAADFVRWTRLVEREQERLRAGDGRDSDSDSRVPAGEATS
jgi:hypothetical protein